MSGSDFDFKTYIQKGEAVLVYSDVPYDERIILVRKTFSTHTDVVIFEEEKMKMDSVRDFIYEMQKGSTGGLLGVQKIGILICDDIVLPAQHALLKILEDINPQMCIIVYAHTQSVFLSTVLSRVVEKREIRSHAEASLSLKGNTVAEKLESAKKIAKEYDDEKITKQDIIAILECVKGNKEVYARALSMMKQPSVLVKYVLEYVAVHAE